MNKFKNWKKQDNALSNDVFYKDNVYCKKYSKNGFNENYGNKERKLMELINPNIVVESNLDFLCTREIPGSVKETSNLTDQDIKNISNELKRIHSIEISDDRDLIGTPDFYKTWIYLKTIKEIPFFSNDEEIFKKGMKIVNQDLVISNNDIVEGNILVQDDSVAIIDYEYGGINSKYFDIASFIIKRHLSDEQEKIFLNSYFEDIEMDSEKLKVSKDFCKVFWSKWAWFKYFETKKQVYKEIAEWLIKR